MMANRNNGLIVNDPDRCCTKYAVETIIASGVSNKSNRYKICAEKSDNS